MRCRIPIGEKMEELPMNLTVTFGSNNILSEVDIGPKNKSPVKDDSEIHVFTDVAQLSPRNHIAVGPAWRFPNSNLY